MCTYPHVGETGWYSCQDMLFYFCLFQDNFLLLCGPITKALYDVAYDDLMTRQGEEVASAFTSVELHIDHLALQATRTQIQLLIDTVRIRDSELAVTRSTVENLSNEHEMRVYEYQFQIQELKAKMNTMQTLLDGQRGVRKLSLPKASPRIGLSSTNISTGNCEDEVVVNTVKEKPAPKISPRYNSNAVGVV